MKQKQFKSNFVSTAKTFGMAVLALFVISSCIKDPVNQVKYYEVGITENPVDWQDSSFVVATSNPLLIQQIEQQLMLPVF